MPRERDALPSPMLPWDPGFPQAWDQFLSGQGSGSQMKGKTPGEYPRPGMGEKPQLLIYFTAFLRQTYHTFLLCYLSLENSGKP